MALTSFQCSASNDDARQNSGTVGLTAGSIRIVKSNQWLGFRFPGVTTPAGAPVTDVYVIVDIHNGAYDSPGGCTVGLQDVDDAPVFTTATNNISNRTRVGTVAWSGLDVGIGQRLTPSLLTQFESVIARPGWSNGNAMACLIQGASSTDLNVTTYDGSPAWAASLVIEYTPAGGQPAIARGRLVPGMRRPHGSQGW